MAAHVRRRDGNLYFDGGANTLAAQNACSCVFSPVSPHFRGTTGRQQNSLTLILFSPREPLFHRRIRGSQGVAVAAHVRRRDGNLYFDGGQRRRTGRQQNSLRLFCFLPVNLVFVVAFAPLKVSLWRRMSADATGIFILTGEQTPSLRVARSCVFSPVSPHFRRRVRGS